ncbi:Anti-sigma regulatory factor (Ser/Thr protein kinase) [Candidatus Zixiibacteriota bacterium]|nr:Anti-sigma regulatory factor (Ser/Thr protein kinase) [candidate division Zixibacteria bacterium]
MKKPTIVGNTISIPSSQDFLVDVDSFLEGKLRGFGVDDSLVADIAISVTEIVNNAIIHGNKSDPGKAVTIEIAKNNGAILITISDEGNGFDPGSVQSPIEENNLMREVGRGIFIVRSLMDDVVFEIRRGKGTSVTLTKKL